MYRIDHSKNTGNQGKDIVLVLTPGWGRVAPPYGLALMTATLKDSGFNVMTLDLNNEFYHSSLQKDKILWNWEESLFWQQEDSTKRYIKENDVIISEAVDKILKTGARIVGFSIYSSTRLMSIEMAARIKKKDSRVKIIFGGAECDRRLSWQELLHGSEADYLVFGESEKPFPKLVGNILNGLCNTPPGVAYKKKRQIVDTGYGSQIDNLDKLPFADFSPFDIDRYKGTDPVILKIATSRGCIQRCAYCSTCASVKRFRTMSSEKIFQEISHYLNFYIKTLKDKKHLYFFFLDLLLNADINVFRGWVSALARARETQKSFKYIEWYGQIILRDGMDKELLTAVKRSGCNMLNYGVESGSSKVLKDMKKNISPEKMGQIIEQIHGAGIRNRGNFIIGFPTETEEDFAQTIKFIAEYGKYMDEIYPSRTFCALERFSYMDDHKEEFGITLPHKGGENLFWESQGGKNNYIVRLKRYEQFCEVASSLVHNPLKTGVSNVKRDNKLCLGSYYKHIGNYQQALESFQEYINMGGSDKSVKAMYDECKQKIKSFSGKKFNTKSLQPMQQENSHKNEEEANSRVLIMESTPPNIYLQLNGPCNHNCIFCSKPNRYEFFNLKRFKKELGKKIEPVISKSETIYLTGAGEFLLLPEAESILDYFDTHFPHVKKMFATNASMLTPSLIRRLIKSPSRYSIHISLHASNESLHKRITNASNFKRIIENIQYLSSQRNQESNIELHLMSVLTTLNISDLPFLVQLASWLDVDRLYCEYMSIYKPEQKHLSCYYMQEETNDVFKKAQMLASNINMKLDLPSPFQCSSTQNMACSNPWTQIMLNTEGEVLPCCLFKDFNENVIENSFTDIWNGKKYKEIRKSIKNNEGFCAQCKRNNPCSIDNLGTHVITRGLSQATLEGLLLP